MAEKLENSPSRSDVRSNADGGAACEVVQPSRQHGATSAKHAVAAICLMTWIDLRRFFAILLLPAVIASAQSPRKPGLWELTTNMTWQQSPFPGPMASSGSGTRTTTVCLTQQQIEKYGAAIPTPQGACQIGNIVKTADVMTADLVCTGAMNGKASVQSAWTDTDRASGTIHFAGTMQIGSALKSVEWTNKSVFVYKGPDCGSFKPTLVPDK